MPILAVTGRQAAGRPKMGRRKGPSKSLREDFVMSRVPRLLTQSLREFHAVERALDRVGVGPDGYPPYNSEGCAPMNVDRVRLTTPFAVAGFTRDQLDV